MPINTQMTGAAIAAHRQRMNLSQQGLAGLMNVTHQAVSKWEKGLALPDTETLLALAKLFGTSMEDLLMGRLPAEEKTEPAEAAEVPEPMHAEAVSDLPPAEAEGLDFSAVMNMLPFVSTKVADKLFRTYTQNSRPDAGKLISLAPFVSTQVLADYVNAHPLKDATPEVAASLAPFLPTEAVDNMVLGMEGPLPPHVMQMLLPFTSAKIVDRMVLEKLGMHWEENTHCAEGAREEVSQEASAFEHQLQDRIHQRIRQKLDAIDLKSSDHPLSANAKRAAAQNAAPRESPRMRLIRKALETSNYDMIENWFDDLDTEAHRLLLNELAETGDAKLLALLCESAGELEPNEQSDLVQYLIKGRMYHELAEVIDELEEDVQHELLDRAFESNDPELLHIISEHL